MPDSYEVLNGLNPGIDDAEEIPRSTHHGTGLWILMKRFERGSFSRPKPIEKLLTLVFLEVRITQ